MRRLVMVSKSQMFGLWIAKQFKGKSWVEPIGGIGEKFHEKIGSFQIARLQSNERHIILKIHTTRKWSDLPNHSPLHWYESRPKLHNSAVSHLFLKRHVTNEAPCYSRSHCEVDVRRGRNLSILYLKHIK